MTQDLLNKQLSDLVASVSTKANEELRDCINKYIGQISNGCMKLDATEHFNLCMFRLFSAIVLNISYASDNFSKVDEGTLLKTLVQLQQDYKTNNGQPN